MKHTEISRFSEGFLSAKLIAFAVLVICYTPTQAQNKAAETGLKIIPIGKIYQPDSSKLAAYQISAANSGSTSIRNIAAEYLEWKKQGYYQRNRDIGQVFTVYKDCILDAVILRTGPSDKAVLGNTPGAKVFMQFFEVDGVPIINDNGTPEGTKAKHGYSDNHRCDDFIQGVRYKSFLIVKGGVFPDVPVTSKDGQAVNGDNGKLLFLRFKLTGTPLKLRAGKRYAFLVGLEMPGKDVGFTLANENTAGINAKPSLIDQYDQYKEGWGLRREGNGIVPPSMVVGTHPPTGVLKRSLLQEALFPHGVSRFKILPTTDGYPDVDTYRDLNFAVEVIWNGAQ